LFAAQGALQANRQLPARRALGIALLLGLGFLACQGWNWVAALRAGLVPHTGMFAITFYLMTGLHALHTLGGLVPLAIVNVRAARGAYTPFRRAGVHYCALYWHFVDAVWLVMFATLWFGS
jgi:cytochrome c oxidase subunit 3